MWYEGYEGPQHVWQSSGGGDDFEPKLGMLPLVFGTIKATVYSLLFAVPVALLSAIYSSEFLHPRIKARIKPAIEMMASLPSVVLGFVAALVCAVCRKDDSCRVGRLAVVPLTYLVAAYLWQLLPRAGLLLARWRFAFICATLPIGVLASALAGPLVERALFAGDLRLWVDGQVGSGLGGWIVLLLPVSALATALFIGRRVNPWLRQYAAWRGTRTACLARARSSSCWRSSSPWEAPPRSACYSIRSISIRGGSSRHLRATQCLGRRLRHGLRDHSAHLHDR